MKPELILQADILDIIFEDRNKEYGAYKLRKDYNGRMIRAMLAVVILVTVLFIMKYWNPSDTKFISSTLVNISDTVIISPPPIESPPAVEPPKLKVATIKNPSFVISTDPETDTLPTIEELGNEVAIALNNQEGEPNISIESPTVESKGDIESIPEKTPVEKPEIYTLVEFMPEFPGGQAAFIRFLSKNLKVPEEAMEPGQKLKVMVQFVIGKEGEISHIEFIETSGEVFEQEVLRVMKKMPMWKPGFQNGERVSVYFKLPVVFEVPEE